MSLGSTTIGNVKISRMIVGGNPFSGFSHQSPERDNEMRHWYTVGRIKDALRMCESLGVTAHISRADHHVMRYLMEYWDEGGKIAWLAQTCPEIGTTLRGATNAIRGGASAVHIHGGTADFLFANNQMAELQPIVEHIRKVGLPAGLAAHNHKVIAWAEDNLDIDYYMCSYYNPDPRDKRAEHQFGAAEKFNDDDRRAMTGLIAKLRKPVIHYKVMAAGRNNPAKAMEFVAGVLRPQDAVCIGIYTKDHPDGMAENIRLLDAAMKTLGKAL